MGAQNYLFLFDFLIKKKSSQKKHFFLFYDFFVMKIGFVGFEWNSINVWRVRKQLQTRIKSKTILSCNTWISFPSRNSTI